MADDYEPLSKRDAAVLIQSVRDADGSTAIQTAAVNLIWSFYEMSRDGDFSDVDLSGEEVEEVLEEFPTTYDDETE